MENEINKNNPLAWVVAVDMGYGHQRTSYPLRIIAPGQEVINANSYKGIPEKDRSVWKTSRAFYEFVSDFKRIPIIGEGVFSILNGFQKILDFYPKRNLSNPNFSTKAVFRLIKNGWGKDLVEKLEKNSAGGGQKLNKPLPIISTFFTPAFIADYFNYPGDVFCVICDADISRSWTPLNPHTSRIKYFAPNNWVVERLKLYGVKSENIFLTGYPLPLENIGSENMEIIKRDVGNRILNLDKKGNFRKYYKPLVDKYLGVLPEKSDHVFTIMFSIGGAGAQKEIVLQFLKSLRYKIISGDAAAIIAAGTKKETRDFFMKKIEKMRLKSALEEGRIKIVFNPEIKEYFKEFNESLRKTDILWTKPSELSFYAGLGVPIIIAPTIGSQEDFNKKWLLDLGAGISQEDPDYAHQWIFDHLVSGRFAEAAMQGFIEIEKLGVYNIQKVIRGE
jgi:hypothetical protein